MTKDVDDSEYWLLPQFLIDDDDSFTDLCNGSNTNDGRNNCDVFGMGFKQDFGSGFTDFGHIGPQLDLGSAVDGSNESDEAGCIALLARKFASGTSLHESPAFGNKWGWRLSGSPESTLSVGLDVCNCCSSRGSPNCLSKVASPKGMTGTETAWSLLHAAAGEIARLRMMEEAAEKIAHLRMMEEAAEKIARLRMMEEATGLHSHCKDRGLVGPPEKPSAISVPQRRSSHNHLSYEQHLKAFHFQLLREQVRQKKFQLSQTQEVALNRGGRKLNASSMGAWPAFEQTKKQQEAISGKRALFLRNSWSSKRECAGTGVFLPRGNEAPAGSSRKKPAYSSVLLHRGNLNFEATVTPPPPPQPKHIGGFGPCYEPPAVRYRKMSGMMDEQRLNVRQPPQDVGLPKEWTY